MTTTLTLSRYSDDHPVDYMIAADDGAWVPASEALELERQCLRQRELLRRCVAALESVPDPSRYELQLIDEARRA